MKKVEHEWKFVIDVPVTQIDSFEFYIKTQWLHENRIQPDFVISEILDIKQESKLEQVNINYYRTCLQGIFTLHLKSYYVYPGECVNISDYPFQVLSAITSQDIIKERIVIQGPDDKKLQCIRIYKKNNPSLIYSLKVAQDYKDCYFKFEQITSGCYQAHTLTLESGLFDYPYEKKDVEPVKAKITVKFQPRDGYTINNNPTLSDFKQYAKQNKDIIVPYERLDKSIYVSDSKRDFKTSEQQYINLYYLLQVQQKFINEQLSKPTTSRKERQQQETQEQSVTAANAVANAVANATANAVANATANAVANATANAVANATANAVANATANATAAANKKAEKKTKRRQTKKRVKLSEQPFEEQIKIALSKK